MPSAVDHLSAAGLRRQPPPRVWVILAMRRSGHHAVLNHLCYQVDEALHLNNCTFREHRSPARPKAGRLRHYRRGEVFDTGRQSARAYDEELARLAYVPHLVYSFEEADLSVDYRQLVVPHSALTVVCVVRDPFNWLASSRRALRRGGRFVRQRIERWQEHVEQCCRPDSYPFGDFVDVNFNRWVTDRDFRVSLSRRLGLRYADRGIDEVVGFGGGSTFSGTRFDGRASEMPVLERWRHCVDDARYRGHLEDSRVRALSRSYFGFEPFGPRSEGS